MNQDTVNDTESNSTVSADELKAAVERAERVQEDIDAARSDMKELKAELKGKGFDIKAFNTILRMRKQDRDARMHEEAMVETYAQAIGLN
jgi:uncharacterized protein (UPF0335 family)